MAVRGDVDVYTENKRVIWTIESPEFGLVTLVIIGAMMVGSIILTAKPDSEIKRLVPLSFSDLKGRKTSRKGRERRGKGGEERGER